MNQESTLHFHVSPTNNKPHKGQPPAKKKEVVSKVFLMVKLLGGCFVRAEHRSLHVVVVDFWFVNFPELTVAQVQGIERGHQGTCQGEGTSRLEKNRPRAAFILVGPDHQ